MEDVKRRIEEELARVGAEYRQVLQSSVKFEKRIRARWRENCLAKDRRIAELEERVLELEPWREVGPLAGSTLREGALRSGQRRSAGLRGGDGNRPCRRARAGRRSPSADEHGIGVSCHPFRDHLVVRLLPRAGD